MSSNFFWEDATQAMERLNGSAILYNDEVITVDRIGGTNDRPTAMGRRWPDAQPIEYRLDDPGFKQFRSLPPLGWVNCEGVRQAVLLERIVVRTRQHGLSDNNVRAGVIPKGARSLVWRDYATFSRVLTDPGYAACVQELYPSFADVVANIVDNTTIAVSRKFAIQKDEDGIMWLWRENTRVGLITGRDTILLLKGHTNLRQEVAESPALPIQNIMEA